MPKMTVSVPDQLLGRLRKKYPDINLSEVARRGVLKKLEKLEELRQRGEL